MYVKSISLKNYRNYGELSIDLHHSLNVLFGDNAQGKTNFIEAIYICGTGRSHRTFRDRELVGWGSEHAFIRAAIEKKDINTTIEIGLQKDKSRYIKVGGFKITKLSELLGCLPVVLFSPEDLRLVKEGPVFRRRFLDTEISQVKPGYYYNLRQYNKSLLERNNLLKSARHDRSLAKTIDVWDEQMARYGSYIVFQRQEFVKRISILARLVHRKITDGLEELNISYASKFKDIKNVNDIREAIYSALQKSIEDDLRRGSTSEGPQRDDMDFFINDMDAKIFGSQGQQRTCALSLKLSELEFIKGECGEYPVLLLDDVLSELDVKRQRYLLDNLKSIQTILTCTSISDIENFRKNDRYVFQVSNGVLNKME